MRGLVSVRVGAGRKNMDGEYGAKADGCCWAVAITTDFL